MANDRIKSLMELDPNLKYERLVRTMFFWWKTKTLFVVINEISDEKSNRLRYYAVNEKESCDQTYHYSTPDYLDSALTSVIQPLDLCFISEDKSEDNSLLYCLGNNSFQINLIDNEFKVFDQKFQSILLKSLINRTGLFRVEDMCFPEESHQSKACIRSDFS